MVVIIPADPPMGALLAVALRGLALPMDKQFRDRVSMEEPTLAIRGLQAAAVPDAQDMVAGHQKGDLEETASPLPLNQILPFIMQAEELAV